MLMLLSDVIIVLSRPAEAGNVGAVCRAMKNMGLSRLRLAAPDFTVPGAFPKAGAGDAEIRDQGSLSEAGFGYGGNLAVIQARAVHAKDVWEGAETFDSLSGAVKDCGLIIGTTRRRGRHRKQITMTPAETAAFLKGHPGPAALVFGNERTGLEDEELGLCNLASHIPADDAFPSLNLSHAVMIYAYELFKALACPEEDMQQIAAAQLTQRAVKGQWVPLDQEAIEALVREISDTLRTLGFYKQRGREEQERFFRDLFSRSGLTEREGRYFTKIIVKAARLRSS
jgi:tRNA/rRNA methyltransferase/tRNA (cytidine32/uridine32-2'-O)-methyltransferase